MVFSNILIIASTVGIALLATIVHRLIFHPLAKVPGPKLAAITNLWLAWQIRSGKINVLEAKLHEIYGPVVRIAPDEVLVTGAEEVRAIYGAGSSFAKGPWYNVCQAPDYHKDGKDRFDLLTESDKDLYRQQRRAIGPSLSVSGIEKHEHILVSYLDTYMERLRGLNGQWVDLADWMHIYSLDALSLITLGKSPGYTQKEDDGGNMVASDRYWRYFSVVGIFPWISRCTQLIPKLKNYLMVSASLALAIRLPTNMPIFEFAVPLVMHRLAQVESMKTVEMPDEMPGMAATNDSQKKKTTTRYGEISTERDNAEEGDEGDVQDSDLLASLITSHLRKPSEFPPSWVLRATLTVFGAGHDTVTMTLSAIFYHLTANPDKMARLVEDLKQADISKDTKYSTIVNRVPYLSACIKEAMRLTPAVGMHLQRVVPATGLLTNGHFLPAGVRVGITPWHLHCSPDIFSDPHQFIPERWIHQEGSSEAKRQEIAQMEQVWMGFGGGSRSCPGQYLARIMMVRMVTRVLGVGGLDVESIGDVSVRGWFSAHMGGVEAVFRERVV